MRELVAVHVVLHLECRAGGGEGGEWPVAPDQAETRPRTVRGFSAAV
jgi:hypothetical protein